MKIALPVVLFAAAALMNLSLSRADDNAAPNSQPNPYQRNESFFKMPPGRTMGSTSAVAIDHAGHIWIADRCGTNSCEGSSLDPVMEFDAHGKFIKAFGGGLMLFPHGICIDHDDHIWVTDGHVGNGKGDDVLEFRQDGKVLRTLGKPGVAGDGPDTFHEPNAVLVAPNGTIFVSDGHTAGKGNSRVIKFDRNGKFIKQWGGHGSGPGQFEVPHTLAMDSKGRLFVGDRANSRVQIFDQDGNFIAMWTQFGKTSGAFIDRHDILYVADSESRDAQGYGNHPGWKRGIRIGSVKDGIVTAFIPDTYPDPESKITSGAEGITVDTNGVIYGGEVEQHDVVRYVKN